MIVLLEIEELVPLLIAVAAEESHRDDIPNIHDLPPGTYMIVNQLLENSFGIDQHPDIPDGAHYAMESSGFSSEIPRVSEAILKLMETLYPNGVMISIEVMNHHGTVALTINPRGNPHARYHSLFRQYR